MVRPAIGGQGDRVATMIIAAEDDDTEDPGFAHHLDDESGLDVPVRPPDRQLGMTDEGKKKPCSTSVYHFERGLTAGPVWDQHCREGTDFCCHERAGTPCAAWLTFKRNKARPDILSR
jgi:hypothetical protein